MSVDTLLIDCNRITSAEYNDPNSNTATFTCKVSDGLKLNVGDTISVHSGFISARGCGGGDAIEITGKDLNYEYEVEETELNTYQKWLNPYSNLGTDQVIQPYGSLPPYDASSYTYKQVMKSKRLADNKMSISITYFKTTNGQGYAHLPRRYGFNGAAYDPNGTGLTQGWYDKVFDTASVGVPYDSWTEGRPMYIDTDGHCSLAGDVKYVKNGTTPPTTGGRTIDALASDTDKVYKYKQDNSRYTLMVCETNFVSRGDQFGVISADFRFISDTARFDSETIQNTGLNRDSYEPSASVRHYRDPCLQEWIIYKETKDIELATGFQSPNSIAAQVTNQLQTRGEFKKIYASAGGTVDPPGPASQSLIAQSQVSVYANSECYKAFPSSNPVEFSKDRWTSYWTNHVAPTPQVSEADVNVVQYVQQFSTLGVKRPELWIAGRNFLKYAEQINAGEYDIHPNGNQWFPLGDTADDPNNRSWRNWIPGQMLNTVRFDDRASGTHDDNKIVTSYLWTEKNLNLLKAWFDEEGKDETLFQTPNNNMPDLPFAPPGAVGPYLLSSQNARFIHMNQDEGAGNVYPYSQLGCDCYENQVGTVNAAGWTVTTASPTSISVHCAPSIPIFVAFDPERTNIAGGGKDENDMYYGFAIRETVTMNDPVSGLPKIYNVISFNTSKLGGIFKYAWGNFPTQVNWAPPTGGTDKFYLSGNKTGQSRLTGYTTPRKLGYDPHFNAFGTAALVLWTGQLDGSDKDRHYVDTDARGDLGSSTKPVHHVIKQRYCGANQPTLNYDPDETKFQWQSLHTPEYTGQDNNAGSDVTTDPINADAGDPVWFLNKHLLRRDFCPDMMPYLADVSFTGSKSVKVSAPNINIEPWTIFDSLGGIFFEGFNIPEDKWQNSLMGILGFQYSQFGVSATTNTRQRRLNDEITLDPQGIFTTNAVVNSSDIIQFRSNVYGGLLYEQSLPVLETDTDTASINHVFYSLVSDKQTSISVEALRLPRRMLTPYYIVRSDIISDSNYHSNGKEMDIVYVINKENGFGDFFFQSTSETTFTVTKQKMLTDVKTTIHNPDMSIANLSEGSGIIYKVIKNNNADMNVASEILNKNKKK